MISNHFNKHNLHHAYLIEGAKEEIVLEILKFFEDLGIKTIGNSDFIHINLDSFKVEDARNLKSYGAQKSFSIEKKIIIVSTNNFLLEAQNSLLKIFEEPIDNTHFFIVVPDANSLLKTFISRFYFISTRSDLVEETKEVEKFLAMPLRSRIDFIKELLTEQEEEEVAENEIIVSDSIRSKALKFLNALETQLHNKISKTVFDIQVFEHIFKVREFLRMPGSSTKSLMESIALILPVY